MGARNKSLLRLSQRAGVGLVAEGGLCEAPYNVMYDAFPLMTQYFEVELTKR